jgi:hypothetical protein
VANTSARRTPSRAISATVSSTIGCQLRLPKYTGSGVRSRTAAISSRLRALSGLIPSKWR